MRCCQHAVQVVKHGNRVILDMNAVTGEVGGYLQNLATGERMALREANGTIVYDVRLDDEDLRDDDDREGVREENCSRGDLGALRQLRDRARGAIQRGEDSDVRGDQIREALSEGRRWVDRLLGVRDDRESARDGEGERPR